MNAPLTIVGGGIGGLATALALAEFNIKSNVYEKSNFANQQGAGIQLSPNASKILERLDIIEDLLPDSAVPSQINIISAITNRKLCAINVREAITKRYQGAYLTCNRKDLHNCLLKKAITSRLINIYDNCHIGNITETTNGISFTIKNKDGLIKQTAQFLILADGVGSNFRQDNHRSIFSGFIAWRSVSDDRDLPANIDLHLGHNFHLVEYPINPGRNIVNKVLITGADNNPDAMNNPDPDQMLASLNGNCNQVFFAKKIVSISNWRPWPIFIHKRVLLTTDTIALVGDAAHASLPFAAQGAVMALEDAWELAACLKKAASVKEALIAYSQSRLVRVNKIRRNAMINGWLYHLNPILAAGRDLILKTVGPRLILRRADYIYSYAP